MTLQFTKRTLCDPSRPSVFLVSPESQLFAQDRKCPSPMPRPSRQNLPSLPKQPVSFTMLFERKIGFLKRELFVKHHHTFVTYLHLRKKKQYGLINLPKRISMEKSDLKILVKKTQLQSSASSSSLVSPEFRSKTGVFAGAVNVSMEGSPHLVTLLLSPFTQSQPHP